MTSNMSIKLPHAQDALCWSVTQLKMGKLGTLGESYEKQFGSLEGCAKLLKDNQFLTRLVLIGWLAREKANFPECFPTTQQQVLQGTKTFVKRVSKDFFCTVLTANKHTRFLQGPDMKCFSAILTACEPIKLSPEASELLRKSVMTQCFSSDDEVLAIIQQLLKQNKIPEAIEQLRLLTDINNIIHAFTWACPYYTDQKQYKEAVDLVFGLLPKHDCSSVLKQMKNPNEELAKMVNLYITQNRLVQAFDIGLCHSVQAERQQLLWNVIEVAMKDSDRTLAKQMIEMTPEEDREFCQNGYALIRLAEDILPRLQDLQGELSKVPASAKKIAFPQLQQAHNILTKVLQENSEGKI